MISTAIQEILREYVPEEQIHLREPMAAHTTFRVGGPADCLVEVDSAEQLQKILLYLHRVEYPYVVVGNGSNLLVSDKGYEGIVLAVGRRMSAVTVDGTQMRAQAGGSMAQLSQIALKNGLTGLEFASGIPGTIGGGVVMNAGAYGGELAQVVQEVQVVGDDGEIWCLDNETMEFGYRKSTLRGKRFAVTEVRLALTPGDPVQIKAKMDELAAQRRTKQPLEFPSAGSTFKRPEGYYAGELIMKAGMRGFQVGGARVSDKHCGFVINTGNATASDVMDVICEVKQRVKECFGVELEPEIVFLGDF
ncbi:MAG: UDP-N-acetylmuramate dehydrogenase [Lachnospiraceae bacterium]|nr:UDP-N-acetylmuramate dehydrogenase [Lachnospiraceae bacterium]